MVPSDANRNEAPRVRASAAIFAVLLGWGCGSEGDGATPKFCRRGTWDHDGDPATACMTWRACDEGQVESYAGSATQDRVCVDRRQAWQFGAEGLDTSVRSLAVDRNGNVYVAGITALSVDHTSSVLTSYQAFVRKYCANGDELWTKQFAKDVKSEIAAVAVDGNNHVIVAGTTDGDLDDGTRHEGGNRQAYLRKYDPDGNELWTRQFGTQGTSEAAAMAVDGNNNVIVVGTTEDDLDDRNTRPTGDTNAYVRKYDPNGVELWTTQTGGYKYVGVTAVAVDGEGNAFVANNALEKLGDGSVDGSAESGGAYVLRYQNTDGATSEVAQLGGGETTSVSALAVDDEGNVFVAGYNFIDWLDDVPGTTLGEGPSFVRKYTADGSVGWTALWGANLVYAEATSVAVDPSGNVFVAGYNFYEPGEGADVADPFIDAYVRTHATDGTLLDDVTLRSGPFTSVNSLVVDDEGTLIVAGDTRGDLFGTRTGISDGFVSLR